MNEEERNLTEELVRVRESFMKLISCVYFLRLDKHVPFESGVNTPPALGWGLSLLRTLQCATSPQVGQNISVHIDFGS